MTVNPKQNDIERMKRKAYYVLYRMHICRLITNQAMDMYGLFFNKEGSNNHRLEEIENYRKLLNKVWLNLKEKETLLFQEMIDLNFNSLEMQSVMSYAEQRQRYNDNYAIIKMYGIDLGDIKETESRINSIIL